MKQDDSSHRPVIIIGAGAAGLTAAIYAARASLKPLVIRGPEPGGQLATTTLVENYPGFIKGILGPELMQNFEAQAARFGTDFVDGYVTAVDFSDRPFRLTVDGDRLFLADTVIVATGASPRFLGLVNERRLLGRGVSTCATCDGPFYRDQVTAVVGGGDAALENALALSRFAKEIVLIHRRNRLRASKIMQHKAKSQPKISFIWNAQVIDVLGEDEVEGLLVKHLKSGETSTLAAKGLFLAIGHQPNTEVFQDWLQLDQKGYIRLQPGSTATSVEGVFACGDVHDNRYRQAVTAAGNGCRAAIDAERWLHEQH